MKLNKNYVTYMNDETQIMVSIDSSLFSGIVRSNETAAFVIDSLKEETDIESIVKKILSEYEVSEEKAREDIGKVIDTLKTIGALDECCFFF